MVNAQKYLNPKCTLDFPFTMVENKLLMIDRIKIGNLTFHFNTIPIDIPFINLGVK